MARITYDQAALICLYDGITKTVNELELHYQAHPSNSIKEEILDYLEQQKDCLMSMKKSGINNCFFKYLVVNAKRLATKNKLRDNNKVVSSRKVANGAVVASILLISSVALDESVRTSLIEKGKAMMESDFVYWDDILFGKLEKETVEVTMDPIVGGEVKRSFCMKTLTYDKYYDIPCSKELQDYFFELEEKWEIPANVAMTLVDRESDGQWSTNGVISPTNDYGLSQINIRNHAYIYRKLGYTSNDLLNDPYKNLDAMFLLLTSIFNQYGYTKDNYDLLEVAGAYNGWINWKNIDQSVEYANGCIDIYNTKFTKGSDAKLLVLDND